MNSQDGDVLSELVRAKLDGYRLIVVSNWQPFQHSRPQMVSRRPRAQHTNVYRWAGKFISELSELKSPRQHSQRNYPSPVSQSAIPQLRFRSTGLGVAV